MNRPKRKKVSAEHLMVLATSESLQDSREPQLTIGDLVVLNSGGPVSLIVGETEDKFTVAWQYEQVYEYTAYKACFHRARNITGGWAE